MRTAIHCLTAAIFLATLPAPVSAQIYTLGTTPDCDLEVPVDGGDNLLQTALDAGHRDLRIQRDLELPTHIEQVGLGQEGIAIRGGYDSCADARNDLVTDPSARTRLRADGAVSMLLRQSPASLTPTPVVLERLDLRQPVPPATPDAAIRAESIDLQLIRSSIDGFAGNAGGAIRVVSGRVHLVEARLAANHAFTGGGILCINGAVMIDGRSLLQGNRAERGGAVFADGCELVVEARPEAHPPGLLNHGLIANEAVDAGGALFVRNGQLRIQGGPHCEASSPVNCLASLALVRDNRAGNAGGGIVLSGAASALLRFVELHGNRAPEGGGIKLRDSAALAIGEGALPPGQRPGCENLGFCQRISGNGPDSILLSPGSRGGGAIRASGGQVHVLNTWFENNYADIGNVVLAESGATVLLEQSIIRQWNAPDPEITQWLPDTRSVLHARGAELALRQMTLLREHGNSVDVGQPTLIRGENGSDVAVDNSIALGWGWSELHFDIEPERASGACNLVNQANLPLPFQASAIFIPAQEPSLFDPDAPFSPSATSGARDRCPQHPGLDLALDIHGRSRVQLLNPTAAATPLDIGAVEASGPLLFSNGFE